ncbi:MAG: hypothetical protein JWL61_2336 [Gemmatimonadetes bacterium]|nr:hypothetical protein [Gemmatimonadota bacterium]
MRLSISWRSVALSFWVLLVAMPASGQVTSMDTSRAAIVYRLDSIARRLDTLSRDIAAIRALLTASAPSAAATAPLERVETPVIRAARAPATTDADDEEVVFELRTKFAGCRARSGLPDKRCTPGKLMTQSRSIICNQSTRERRDVPTSLKKEAAEAYGLSYPAEPGFMEIDHLIPLALGGDNAIENLWPEIASPTPGFHEKDRVELNLHNRVCAGELSLREAVQIIAGDWKKYYRAMLGTP